MPAKVENKENKLQTESDSEEEFELEDEEKKEKQREVDLKYREENKDNVGAEKQRYDNAYRTINDKTTSMKVLSGIVKTHIPGVATIARLIRYGIKKKAMNYLASAKVRMEAAEEQKKDYDERSKNLEELNVKMQEEQLAKEQQQENSPQNKEQPKGPNSDDAQYKQYSGGRGLDVLNNAEILAKSNDEMELTDFKKQVLNDYKADLEEHLMYINKGLAENERELNRYCELHKDTGITPKIVHSFLENEEDIARLEKEAKAMLAQNKKDLKRLKSIPKDADELASQIYSAEDDEKKQAPIFEEDKKKYEEAKANLKEKIQALEKLKPYYDAKYVIPGRENEEHVMGEIKGSAINIRWNDAKAELDKAKESFKEINAKYKKTKDRLEGARNTIKGNKERLKNLFETRDKLEQSTKSFDDRYKKLNKQIDDKKFTKEINQNKLGKEYDRLKLYSYSLRDLTNKRNDCNTKLANAEKDVLDSKPDKALLDVEHNMASVQCLSVGGRLYLNKKELKEKGLPNKPRIEFNEQRRLIAAENLRKYLKSRPIFHVLNSNNLAEYATYNEETGDFDLYKGDIKDKTAREKHDIKLRNEYFPSDIIFDTHLIENDPKGYVRNQIGSFLTESWSKVTETLTDVKNNPTKYLKKGAMYAASQIPIAGTFIKAKMEEDDVADYETVRKQLDTIPETIGLCFKALDKLNGGNPVYSKAISDKIADLSMIQSMQKLNLLGTDAFEMSIGDVGSFVTDTMSQIKEIVETAGDKKRLSSEMQIQLEQGHQRFGRIMQQACATANIKQVNAIIEMSAGVATQAFQMATGFTGPVAGIGIKALKAVASGIYNHVAEKKKDEDILKDPNVLGDLNIEKNVLSEDDINQVFREVTGIQDMKSFADMVRITDAIDMHRTLVKDRENTNIPGLMNALGFKAGSVDKVSVGFLVEKISGNDADYKQRIRSAIEEDALHPSPFKRWVQKTFGKVKDRLMGKRKGNLEYTVDKQRKIQEKKLGKDALRARDAGTWLLDGYKERIKSDHAKGVDPKDMKLVKGVASSELLIRLFSNTSSAKAIFNQKNFDQDFKIKPEVMDKLLDKAIDEANALVKKANEAAKQQEKLKQQPNKDTVNKMTGGMTL